MKTQTWPSSVGAPEEGRAVRGSSLLGLSKRGPDPPPWSPTWPCQLTPILGLAKAFGGEEGPERNPVCQGCPGATPHSLRAADSVGLGSSWGLWGQPLVPSCSDRAPVNVVQAPVSPFSFRRGSAGEVSEQEMCQERREVVLVEGHQCARWAPGAPFNFHKLLVRWGHA